MGFFTRAPNVSADEQLVVQLLSRSVENVIPRELAVKKLRSGGRLRIYFGIDPTGAKLHLGHAVPLRKLREFSRLGHEVIFVVGSFTAMIGDPTGRDAARGQLTRAQVEENFKDYKRQAQKVLDLSKVEVRYNHEWLEGLGFEEIVKLASNFTVQHMLQRDMFEKRIREQKPISLHEFLYPLMVGYDSVVLDVDAELGGSDQEFNMLAGRHLQQRLGKRDKFVLTTKLIEGTDGRKMSKTFENCIYLDDTSAEMFGKIMSVKDELIETYFEAATDLSLQDIAQMAAQHPKDAKMRLAREVVTLYHNKEAAQKAEENFVSTFSKGEVPTDAPELQLPAQATARNLAEPLGISTSELRRLVEQGAIEEVGGKKITNIDTSLKNGIYKIGKHRFLKVTVK